MEYPHRDRPFSGHWRAPELVAQLNLKPARNAALDAMRSAAIAEAIIAAERGQAVSYSRDKAFYLRARRYFSTDVAFTTVPPAVDELAASGAIISHRVPPGSHNKMRSTFEVPSALLAVFRNDTKPFEHHPRESIWLRDSEKRPIDYPETRQTAALRRIMDEINDGMRQIRIDVPDGQQRGSFLVLPGKKGDVCLLRRPDNGLVRIFNNGSFAQGGRMFGWHQGITKGARKTMTIDGDLIAEADFAAMHISILYTRAGLRLDGDAYDVGRSYDAGHPEITRQHVKRAVNTVLNATSRHQAAWAIKTELEIPLVKARKLIEAVERRHAKISRHFFTGIGMEMMRIESDIMADVVRKILAAGIPILPCHDAALVQLRHYDIVEAEMIAAFERVTGSADVVVRRKKHC
jgi:hypothetical protein